MFLGHIWDFFVNTLMALFIPVLCSYYLLNGDIFLNVSATDAKGLEYIGNTFLTPLQYLAAGKVASQKEDGSWQFTQRFDYNESLWLRSLSSVLALPASVTFGSIFKAIAFVSKETRDRHFSMLATQRSTKTTPNISYYQSIGINPQMDENSEFFASQGYKRRPGDENHLRVAREALREIGKILTEEKIPWWVDCGTLLGTYRYGGVIPWDEDIDISVLMPDFENVRRALNRLDPKKYAVQDWSGRDFPNTFIKVYVKETKDFIDIDMFSIDPNKKQVECIFSLEKNIFFFEWWKIRERRFKEPIGFESVFPLKKAVFDSVEVFIPNNPEKFLQRYYGENLAPAKVFDPKTGMFEKDLSHPYWQRAYVH